MMILPSHPPYVTLYMTELLRTLDILDISDNGLGSRPLPELDRIFQDMPKGMIDKLILKRNKIGFLLHASTNASLCFQFLKHMPKVTELDLEDNVLSQLNSYLGIFFKSITDTGQRLSALNLSNNGLYQIKPSALALAFTMLPKTITELRLDNNGLWHYPGIPASPADGNLTSVFAALATFPLLTTLHLNRNSLGFVSTSLIEALHALPATITTLDLNDNDLNMLNDESLGSFCAAIPSGVATLHLKNNGLTTERLFNVCSRLPASVTEVVIKDFEVIKRVNGIFQRPVISVPIINMIHFNRPVAAPVVPVAKVSVPIPSAEPFDELPPDSLDVLIGPGVSLRAPPTAKKSTLTHSSGPHFFESGKKIGPTRYRTLSSTTTTDTRPESSIPSAWTEAPQAVTSAQPVQPHAKLSGEKTSTVINPNLPLHGRRAGGTITLSPPQSTFGQAPRTAFAAESPENIAEGLLTAARRLSKRTPTPPRGVADQALQSPGSPYMTSDSSSILFRKFGIPRSESTVVRDNAFDFTIA